MNFELPSALNATPEAIPVKNEKGQVSATSEEIAVAEQWLSDHPVQVETKKGPEEKIVEFENMVADFEATYSLDQLNAIVDLSSDPERKHPLRDQAKEALKPIFAKLKALKEETTASSDVLEELTIKWKLLSRAVGMVNKGMVDHTR
ncbi:MAG: hypothetical protein WBC83_03715 [Minisyncoccia bacterium]